MLYSKTLGFFTIDKGTILLTLINTLVLFLILKKFLFGRINTMLAERQANVQKTYSDAEQAQQNAKKLENDYTLKMQSAKDEAGHIISSAVEKAQMRSDEIIVTAKSQANSIREKASSDIEIEKKRAVNEAKYEISSIAFMVAGKVVEKEINVEDNEKLVNDFIASVGEL